MDEFGLSREEIIELAKRANRARREGFSNDEVSEYLQETYGFTRDDLFQMMKDAPKYETPKPLSTKDMLNLMDQGSSFGLAGGVGDERLAELRELGHDKEIAGMRALGAGGSALTLGTAGLTANILRKTGPGLAPQLIRSGSIRKALQEISPSVGAAAKGTAEAVGGGVKKVARAITRNRTASGLASAYVAKKLGLLDWLFK